MKNWYYAKDGQQFGPMPEAELTELTRSGQLGPDVLVWTEGIDDWKPARDFEGFVPSNVYGPSQSQSAQAVLAPPQMSPNRVQERPVSARVRPWVRYFARLIDIFIFAPFLGVVLGIVAPGILELPEAILGIIVLFLYVFAEAAMMGQWGTTPGKALFRVQLRQANGRRLTGGQALNRSFKVWIRGMGLGLPIVSLITLVISYNHLSKHGTTAWDESENTVVSHRDVGVGRVFASVVIMVAYVFLITL